VKREDEFVKRFWSVSDIFAGTVAERVFQRVSVAVELEGERNMVRFTQREELWRWIRWLAALRAGPYPGRLVLLSSVND
jgi:hypothetical protein